ncbi:hypothetical protein BDW67DRAFT_160329 [Aspergillus spinulosporus]
MKSFYSMQPEPLINTCIGSVFLPLLDLEHSVFLKFPIPHLSRKTRKINKTVMSPDKCLFHV